MDFLEKVRCLLSTSSCIEGFRWSEHVENAVEIDLCQFEKFLIVHSTLFETKDIFNFLCQLSANGFKRLPRIPSDILSNVYRFQHVNFMRNPSSDELSGEVLRAHENSETLSTGDIEFVTGAKDSEKMEILDAIELRTLMKLFAWHNQVKKPPAEISPHLFDRIGDAVSVLQQDEYAGYYGFYTDDLIQKFFGNYLPVFASASPEPQG